MKNIPVVFGFPLWYGNIKRRVAKKYINSYSIAWTLKDKCFANYKVGDIINDCSGKNIRIAKMEPEYLYRAGGFVLLDIIFVNEKGGCCSFKSCGIEEPKSREIIENNYIKYMDEWFFFVV